MGWLGDARIMATAHGWATVGWVVLSVVTTAAALLFPEHPTLLAWVIFMSGYANAASHWSAKQAADAERHQDQADA